MVARYWKPLQAGLRVIAAIDEVDLVALLAVEKMAVDGMGALVAAACQDQLAFSHPKNQFKWPHLTNAIILKFH